MSLGTEFHKQGATTYKVLPLLPNSQTLLTYKEELSVSQQNVVHVSNWRPGLIIILLNLGSTSFSALVLATDAGVETELQTFYSTTKLRPFCHSGGKRCINDNGLT